MTPQMTIADIERLASQAEGAAVAFDMDEEAFRAFYDRTSRVLWAYLSRIARDPQAADDLLQESYYRLLRARVAWESETHRRNYLFRIATNVARDARRRIATHPPVEDRVDEEVAADTDLAERTERRADVQRAMRHLKQRERALLWLAYGHGSSHRDIGEVLGVKATSVKLLLFRARRRLAAILRDGGEQRR